MGFLFLFCFVLFCFVLLESVEKRTTHHRNTAHALCLTPLPPPPSHSFQKQYRPTKRDIAAHLHHKQRAVDAHNEDVKERRRSKLSGGGGSTRASVDNVLRPPGSDDI